MTIVVATGPSRAARTLAARWLLCAVLAGMSVGCGEGHPPAAPPLDPVVTFHARDGGTLPVDAHFADAHGEDAGTSSDLGTALVRCRAAGEVALLDTSTWARTEGVAVTASGSAFAVAFPAFRADGTNIVVRALALDGALGAEALASGTYLMARNPDVAATASGVLALFETNDSGAYQVAVRSLVGGAPAGATPTTLTSSAADLPVNPVLAPRGTGLVGAWLTHSDDGLGAPGPARAVVALFDPNGALLGAPTEVLTAAPPRTLTLARSLDGTSALVTLESSTTETSVVRLRSVDAAGVVAASALDVTEARAVTSIAAAQTAEGTLVAWGETVGGARQDVRLRLVSPEGSLGDERFATLGPETGSTPALAVGATGVLLAYRGGQGVVRGVRAVAVDSSGALAGTVVTLLDTSDDDGDLAVAASGLSSLAVIASDRVGGSGRVQAVVADCGAP